MRFLTPLLLLFLLISCAQPAIQQPERSAAGTLPVAKQTDTSILQKPAASNTPNAKATLIAEPTSLEVIFDGETCTVKGPSELPAGEHLIVFYDLSDYSAYPVPIRHYSGYTFEYEKQWVEENCGPPGSFCDKGSGKYASYQPLKSAIAEDGAIYKKYDFTFETEHSIWAETPQLLLWPCDAFTIIPAE
jgi:hypothetical protein